MSDEWQKVKEIFNAALRLRIGEREVFLDKVCADDEVLRREVESLLSSFDDDSFLEQPAIGEVADVVLVGDHRFENGETFNHYEIISQIGAGGMGEVYLARDKRLDRKVAVKILNEKSEKQEPDLARFIREAKAASALNHPNILVIHEIGETGEVRYIVSEYIEGNTLREILGKKTLKLSEILDISIQIAGALTAAHTAHIVHRDIKPENIMVRPDGFVKILDFGLAKLIGFGNADLGLGIDENETLIQSSETNPKSQLTSPGMILGTVAYMSPEQARGQRVDERTDIFSFGVLVYEMLTGRTPFAGDSVSEIFANLMYQEPPPLSRYSSDVPDELQRIVSKTLRKNKDKRYQTMKGLLADLKELKENLSFEEKLERSASPDDKATAILPATTRGDADKQTAETQNGFSRIIKNRKWFGPFAIAVLLVGLMGLGYWYFADRPIDTKPIESIAVLPFQNGSGNADTEYLSDGITETLISSLSQLPKLDVRASASVFRFKGKDVSLQQISKELKVQAVLTGRVMQRGDDLTFYIELVDAATEKVLWKSDYNRPMTNLTTLQSEITRDVSRKLQTRLSGTDEQNLTRNYTANPEAYQLYLKGLYFRNKSPSKESQKSIEYFRQAVALDPNFALGYAGLSLAYSLVSDATAHEKMPGAREAALKALSLDDSVAEAHAALGVVLLYYDYDFAGAEREFKRALELNPNYTMAHRGYSQLLSALGKHDEAIEVMRQGLEIDPLWVGLNEAYGIRLMYARRYDEAITQLKRTLELDENLIQSHGLLAQIHKLKGNYAEAIEKQAKIRELNGQPQESALIRESFAKGGWKGFLQMLVKEHQQFNLGLYRLASHYAELGEKDKALTELEKAYENRSWAMIYLKVDPDLDFLRDDPRFQELMRKVGFPP